MTSRLARSSLVSLVAVLTGSCGAVLPRSPPSDFFLLTAAAPAAAVPPPAPAPRILLGPVRLPPYLDRRELVTRLAPNQLRVEDLELWAEPLRDSVPRTIERDLATVLGDGGVQRLPWTGATPPTLIIAIEIRRFEKSSHRTVDLAADWTIAEGGNGAVRLRRDTTFSRETTAPGTQAAVTAMSDALAVLSRDIAAGVQQVAPTQSSSMNLPR
jgi:uncharacterized lipoprotein YmbA